MTGGTAPAIWVGTLNDYNAGRLHGEWIDLTGLDHDDVMDEIRQILETSPEAAATGRPSEEWEIMDTEALPAEVTGLGLDFTVDYVTALDQMDTDEQREAFAAYVAHIGIGYAAQSNLDAIVEEFGDAYIGTYDDVTDFAAEFLDAYHPELLDQMGAAGLAVDLRAAVVGWESDWLALADVPGGVAAWRRV